MTVGGWYQVRPRGAPLDGHHPFVVGVRNVHVFRTLLCHDEIARGHVLQPWLVRARSGEGMQERVRGLQRPFGRGALLGRTEGSDGGSPLQPHADHR